MADQAAELQAISEGVVVDPERLDFLGEQFRLTEGGVGLMPLMKFAHAANSGLDSDDMAGLAALYAMVRDCIDGGVPCTCTTPEKDRMPGRHDEHCKFRQGDWDRFERLAIDRHAEGDDIFEFVKRAMEAITARPSRRPSVSSAGSPGTSPSLTASSFVKPPPAGAEDLVSVSQLMAQAGA